MRCSAASTGTTSACTAPVTHAPMTSMRRMARSRLAAEDLTKEMSRPGSSRAPPSSSTFRSSVMCMASMSLGASTISLRPVLRASAASRCARCASSGPYTEQIFPAPIASFSV